VVYLSNTKLSRSVAMKVLTKNFQHKDEGQLGKVDDLKGKEGGQE
jgi:hypothetical protein